MRPLLRLREDLPHRGETTCRSGSCSTQAEADRPVPGSERAGILLRKMRRETEGALESTGNVPKRIAKNPRLSRDSG